MEVKYNPTPAWTASLSQCGNGLFCNNSILFVIIKPAEAEIGGFSQGSYGA